MATFQIDVVSAEHKLFSGEATGLFITTTEGSMGILPGHQPLLAARTSPVRTSTSVTGRVSTWPCTVATSTTPAVTRP